jgi:hypothetical protein
MAGFEPRSSVPEVYAMPTAPRRRARAKIVEVLAEVNVGVLVEVVVEVNEQLVFADQLRDGRGLLSDVERRQYHADALDGRKCRRE